jgi:hypothetical protein
MPKPLTTGRALAQQRRNIKRKVESLNMELATDIHLVVRKHLKRLADWISQDDERYQARPGGLGRKRK